MNFSYQAYDKSGKLRQGMIEAADSAEGTEILRKKGLFVASITSGKPSAKLTHSKKMKHGKKIPVKIVASFARELSVLVSTGTPLIDAIVSIEQQTNNDAWAQVLAQVRGRLEEGDALSTALEVEGDVFGSVFRSLVAAGESSGHLDTMLHRVSVLTRKQAQIKSNLMGALMYPVLLLGVATIVIGLLIGVVLPRFAGMFETLDTDLPASTAALMYISDFVRAYWWGVIPAIAGSVVGICVWITSSSGQGVLLKVALRMPQVGDIMRSFMTARITRLMGVLLDAKVPMIDAIDLTRESMSHTQYKDLLNLAEETVVKGEPISAALSSPSLIVPSVCEAIRNGEQTGRLSDVLIYVSDYLDEDNETVIKSISSLIEPVIMIGLGILVGFVAVSMFLPLFDLTATAGVSS